jgi:hypothetical protein
LHIRSYFAYSPIKVQNPGLALIVADILFRLLHLLKRAKKIAA